MTDRKLRIARLAGWGLSLVLMLSAAPASAQSDADKATARDLANEGQAALDAGDFPKAIDRFARADALFPAPTLKLALARAQVGGGKLVAASETYQAIVREGARPEDPDQFREAVATATQELEQLKPRIPVVVILVEGGQSPEVTLDGAPLSTAALGVKRIIDPGRHTARATAPGMAPAEQTFDLAEGGSAKIRLELKQAASAPPPAGGVVPPGVPPPPPEEEDSGGSILTPIGAIALGLGGASLVVGGITGVLAITEHSTLSDECNSDKECPEDMQGTLDDYRTFGDVSTVTFIVGGILAAGGVTLLIVGASSGGDEVGGRAEPPLLSLTPFVTPHGGGVWGTF